MTREEIKDWAVGNGFGPDTPGRLACPFRGIKVTLEFLARGIRVSLVSEEHGTHRVGTFNAGPGIRLNEFGMIEGLGLSASFATTYVRGTGERPAWMPQAYLDAIGIEAEPSPPSP